MSLKDKMFSFEGRLRRRDYWMISISLGLAIFLVSDILRLVLFGPAYSIFTAGFGSFAAWPQEPRVGWLAGGVTLATLWPSLALSAKRAHDRGHSAGLVIGLLLLSTVYNEVSIQAQPTWFAASTLTMVLVYGAGSLVMVVAMIYVIVFIGFLDGTPGANRFGPSPKGISGDKAEMLS